MRLIDADEVLARIENPYQWAEIARWLRDAPTIERKTGKWIETDSHEPCWFKCDQCGRLSDIKEIYCPTCGASMVNTTCGADMRGEQDDR